MRQKKPVKFKKLVRNGRVAVLYSPGFGAGWSTWADAEHREAMCFEAELVQAVLDGDNNKAAAIAKRKYKAYTGGSDDLRVEWLPVGAQFEVEEYNGSESIHVIGDRNYFQC